MTGKRVAKLGVLRKADVLDRVSGFSSLELRETAPDVFARRAIRSVASKLYGQPGRPNRPDGDATDRKRG